MWTACVVRAMDPQPLPLTHAPRGSSGGPGESHTGTVRRLLPTVIALRDSRAVLFPTVPSSYSYNL
jgi:hypothetical protein